MSGEETELQERFMELRAEEGRRVPRFHAPQGPRSAPSRWLAVSVAVLILGAAALVAIGVRARRTTFSSSDRAAIQSIAAWRPPTQFLLRTPGRAILSTTPAIPDLTAVRMPMRGEKR